MEEVKEVVRLDPVQYNKLESLLPGPVVGRDTTELQVALPTFSVKNGLGLGEVSPNKLENVWVLFEPTVSFSLKYSKSDKTFL